MFYCMMLRIGMPLVDSILFFFAFFTDELFPRIAAAFGIDTIMQPLLSSLTY